MRSQPGPAQPETAPAPNLGNVERQLLQAFRWWLTAQRDNDAVAAENARDALGPLVGQAQAQVVLGYYDVLVRTVARHPARTLHYHPPCCPHATPDELLFLSIVAACQGGHLAVAGALVNLIATEGGLGATLDAASDLALAIMSAGVLLDANESAASIKAVAALGVISLH